MITQHTTLVGESGSLVPTFRPSASTPALVDCYSTYLKLAVFPHPAVELEVRPVHVPVGDAGLDLPDDLQVLRVSLHLVDVVGNVKHRLVGLPQMTHHLIVQTWKG